VSQKRRPSADFNAHRATEMARLTHHALVIRFRRGVQHGRASTSCPWLHGAHHYGRGERRGNPLISRESGSDCLHLPLFPDAHCRVTFARSPNVAAHRHLRRYPINSPQQSLRVTTPVTKP
jgi:hypothetical protein